MFILKLTIISHTEHYKTSDGTIGGWGPTITEINHLAAEFDAIYHVAFLHAETPPPSSLPYTASNIHFVPLRPVGGKGLKAKLQIIQNTPNIVRTVRKTIQKTDVFQFRAPTGMGVFVIPWLTWFSTKKGWYKYAGNWNQEHAPLGYALQRWMLRQQKRKVTINGRWPKQPKQCYTFENPCLTLAERAEGEQVIATKEYTKPFTFCFVGRLEDDKGVQRIIDACKKLSDPTVIKEVHFIGNGPKMDQYKEQCKSLSIQIVFHGFLNREAVFKIYRESEFLLLPSTASEGFPKVIAEAMNFGCIPIVSTVSSIGQYITPQVGFPLQETTSDAILQVIKAASQDSEEVLFQKAKKGYLVSEKFTFEHYAQRIKNDILNQ